ncbi:ubiquitin-like domain-containing CTD phosphatase [Hibiscus syriacus]|uniref:ubiquitin-like domain-containing CTD phosphatase n=1 Tax=Hibiscus syriacus TaxID=106335 RepID=UPI001923E76D|nr:ubiquitin-like domain-containing CTD phosphatase [Hibiscus syriacus]
MEGTCIDFHRDSFGVFGSVSEKKMGKEMAAGAASSSVTQEELTLMVKWSGKKYTVRVCGDDSVAELKRRIFQVTNVLPKRQKLLYRKIKNKLADDSLLLSQIPLKSSLKMTMIGTVEDDLIVDPVETPEVVDPVETPEVIDPVETPEVVDPVETPEVVDPVETPEVIDDFDEAVDIKDKEVNKQKMKRRIDQYKIELKTPCRKGKKLLVLDIDYTLFDHRSTAENPLQLMRPYLHESLTVAYAEYDIMIWSATSMKRIELKMGQLGVLNNPNYKITALLDHLAMTAVQSDTRGIFNCKRLGLIWAQFPEFYSSKNTIMFDDLRRNFVMNPQNGLTIKPFRKAHANRDTDQELVKLTQYLLAIADLDDLSALDHSNWQFFTENMHDRSDG